MAPRVLVIDDDGINRLVFVRMLEAIGFAGQPAAGARDGLAAVAAGGIDAVLMDVQMPDMDGLAATRALRASEAGGRRMPVIGVSAHALPEDRAAALAAGMDDYLTKPVRMADLRWCLDRHMGEG